MKRFILIALLLAMVACNNSPGSNSSKSSSIPDIPDIERSIRAPEYDDVVGDGYDLITENLKDFCVTTREAYKTVGEQSTSISFSSVSNSYEFEKKLSVGFGAHVEAGYGGFHADANFTSNITNGISMSSKTIIVIGKIEYKDCQAFLHNPTMQLDALDLFTSNEEAFRNQYGDGYVQKSYLGEQLYVILKYSFDNSTAYSKQEIHAAINVSAGDMFSGGVSSDALNESKKTLENVQVDSHLYATGGFTTNTVVDSRENFLAVYREYSDFVKAKIDNNETFSVLAREYKTYEEIAAMTINSDLGIFYDKMKEWKKVKARVEIIRNDNVSHEVNTASIAALELINNEIIKCRNRSASARYPLSDEFDELELLWQSQLSTNIYEIMFNGESYSYFIASTFDNYVAQIDTLERQKNSSSTYLGNIGSVYSIEIDNTIPVYQLESSFAGRTLYITTNREKFLEGVSNNNLRIPNRGHILGYVSTSNQDLIDRINSHELNNYYYQEDEIAATYYKIKITARDFQNNGKGTGWFDGYSNVTGNNGTFELANERKIKIRKGNRRGINRSREFFYSATDVPSANISIYIKNKLLLPGSTKSIDQDSRSVTYSVEDLILNDSLAINQTVTVTDPVFKIKFPLAWRFVANVTTIKASYFLQAPNNDLDRSYTDSIIYFKNWDEELCAAKIVGNIFVIAPGGDFSRSHTAAVLNYESSNSGKWSAKLTGNNTFELANNGDFNSSHTDVSLNYKNWEDVNWTAKFKDIIE